VRAIALVASVAAVTMVVAPAHAQDRTLSFKQIHTGETLTVTFKRNGRYDAEGLKKINYILRDWRRNESTTMDPALLDLIWEVRQAVGSKAPIHVLSGYRSPVTNATLRSRSSGVAQSSLHMSGRALDFYLPDVPLQTLRETALKYQRGGVGYYPTSGSPFVHLDTGNPRHWPRMTRQQLAKLFPDGKTVHIPSDGKPMPGYNQAVAELSRSAATRTAAVTSNGRQQMVMNFPRLDPSVPIAQAAALAAGSSRSGGRNLFAALFESGEDGDEEAAAATRTPAAASTGSAAPVPAAPVPAPVPRAPLPQVPVVLASVQPAETAREPVAPPMSAALPAPAAILADVPLPRLRPDAPAPVAVAVAAAAPIGATAPLPMAKPVLEAPANPLPVAIAMLPRERPTPPDLGAGQLTALVESTAGDIQTGSTGAATALAATGTPDLAPFATTFTGIETIPSGRPVLVAIDHRPAAMRPYLAAGTCLRDSVFVTLRHPDQTDLGSLTALTAPVIENRFGDPAAMAVPARRFVGQAVAPVPTRRFVVAALPLPLPVLAPPTRLH
jgi:uncharacterized protein YcbK (DUF882 family)